MPFMYILCVDNDGTCPAQSPLTKATQFPIKRGIIVSDFFFSFFAASVQRDSGQQADEAAGSEQQ